MLHIHIHYIYIPLYITYISNKNLLYSKKELYSISCINLSWKKKYIYRLHQWLSSKESACNAGDTGNAGLIPGLGRSPWGRHGNLLQYSCLENSMDRGDWRVTVHGVAESWLWLKWLSMHTHKNTHMYKTELLGYNYRKSTILQ